MEYLKGGNLRYHLNRKKYFTEEQVKFIAACVILGLEETHKLDLIHKDIKPENIIFDEKGFSNFTQVIYKQLISEHQSLGIATKTIK